MTCTTCGDHGLIKANWADAPYDYAVCLCAVGQHWRRAEYNGKKTNPQWHIWCAEKGVDLSRVFMLEDVLTDEDLRERGFTRPNVVQEADREAALMAAGRSKGKR